MRIKFIDGDGKTIEGLNCIVYINGRTEHCVFGCYTHKSEKGQTYNRRYFIENNQDLEDDTIYIVKQSNKKEQFKTLIHELCHWILSNICNFRRLHKLVDKYLKQIKGDF